MARNPPAQNTPSIIYGTMDTLLAVGAQGAFSNRPSDVFGVQRDAQDAEELQLLDRRPARDRLGHGARRHLRRVPDAQCRDGQQHQHRCRTARASSTVNPQNANPQNPTTAKPAEFLRPYLGYQNITMREHFGTASYNSLQVQLNRRYINGLQFAVAYTFGKTVSDGTNCDPPRQPARPGDDGTRTRRRRSTTTSSINYTWDVPNGSRMWDNALTRGAARRLAALRRHRVRQRRLGRRRPTSTTDNFDFTGGDGGTRPDITGDPLCIGGNCDPTPGGGGSYFNIAAFSRLDGRGDIGNAPVTFYRLPKIVLSNMSIFKNFQLGGGTPHPVPLGGVQRLQPGELVDAQHERAVQSGRRAGQRELRPGDAPRARARHAGGDAVHFLSRGDERGHRRTPRTVTDLEQGRMAAAPSCPS